MISYEILTKALAFASFAPLPKGRLCDPAQITEPSYPRLFGPARPSAEFDALWDDRLVTIVVYPRTEWESIPVAERPKGAFSRDDRSVACVIPREAS